MTAELGTRIRAARVAQGASLRATAAAAEISPSLLSQVETGKVQPSVSTLYAIVSVLGLSVDDVLGTGAVPRPARTPRVDPVQRRESAPEIRMENGVSWRGLAVMDTADSVDSLLVTYQPGAASSLDDTHMRHRGTEYGYIVRGELTLKLDFETFVLRPGDSFCFDSQRPHLYRNDGTEVAEGVWFVIGLARSGEVDDAPPVGVRDAVDVLDALGRMPGRTEG